MNFLDYAIIFLYIGGFLCLGFIFKNQADKNDYYLGGRSFGWFPLAMSTAATQLSAVSFISAPAFVGLKEGGGMVWLTYEFAVPLAMIFLMVVLVPTFYKSGIVSVYEFLERRFDASTRVLLSIVFQISRAFGTGVMIYTVAIILESVMEIPMWQSIVIIGIVTMIYSLFGGMKAVVYGDMIQMIILFVGIIICFGFGLHYLGGWGNFVDKVDPARLTAVDFSSLGVNGDGFGFWPMLVGGFFLYVSYYGTDQSQVQRLLSASSVKTMRQTLVANGLLRFPVTLAYCVMGLVVGTFAMNEAGFFSQIPTGQPDKMIPVFIKDYLPNGVIGLLIVAIFSAAMSSLSSAVNSLSAASVEDLFARGKDLPEKKYMGLSRMTALFWGVVCVVIAFFVGDIADTVIEAINKVGSVSFGPILAIFIAAMLVKKINGLGANIGLLAGVGLNVYMWLAVPDIFWFWWNAIGAVVTFAVAYLVSTIAPNAMVSGKGIEIEPINFNQRSVYLLLAFFAIIVWVSVSLPNWF
ncbi:MAG: sodium/solute symporter [Roseivirga sp.]|nr:sodium/solute symporter [Roseivirga sp.]